jgi:hypothetical protein
MQPPILNNNPPADAGVEAAGVELVSQGGVQLLVALGALLELALDVVGALRDSSRTQRKGCVTRCV